jgi:hypothetical protein
MTFIRYIDKASRARTVKVMVHDAVNCTTRIAVNGFDPTYIELKFSMASSRIHGAGHA